MGKTNITTREIQKLASLAKLHLKSKQIDRYRKQLSEVLSYVETINSADTKSKEVMSQVIELNNIFREDIVAPSLSQEDALKNAKSSHGGFFKVKSIF